MSGYSEPTALEETAAAIEHGTLSVLRVVGELLLFGLLTGWVAGWAGVAWVTYAQGHLLDLVILVVSMIVLPVAWYAWRALGHLPVERPDLSVHVPVPTSG